MHNLSYVTGPKPGHVRSVSVRWHPGERFCSRTYDEEWSALNRMNWKTIVQELPWFVCWYASSVLMKFGEVPLLWFAVCHRLCALIEVKGMVCFMAVQLLHRSVSASGR